jgi:tetratricopeptide (TPR) repeat protein
MALSLEPENPLRIYNLAYFLIDKNRNINEGMQRVEKALKLQPDNYSYLDCKGWGLFKQGQNKEALSLLQKSDSLKPIYNHQLFLHIQEVKKTVPQKN